MPTNQLINKPTLINQYPILTPKLLINNNNASSIKKSVVTLFSAMNNSFLIYLRRNFWSAIFYL